MKTIKNILLLLTCNWGLLTYDSHAQSVAINSDGSTPGTSAMLDIVSTSK